MSVKVHIKTVSLLCIIVFMYNMYVMYSINTSVRGHSILHRSQEEMHVDERMQVSFVHGMHVLGKVVKHGANYRVDWDENAAADPWKLVSDR